MLALLVPGCGSDESSKGTAGAQPNEGARIASESATEDGKPGAYQPTGPLLADVGFRPEKDGFSFQNYGDGYAEMGPAEMEQLFGPRVCASRQANECVLTPPAAAWLAQTNKWVKGGHCFGFSVTALMMFDKLLNASDFGGAAAPQLSLLGNLRLQARLSQSWALVVTPKVQLDTFVGPPNEILERLTAALKSHTDTLTLSFYKPDWTAGHSVTPYAIEDKGGGKQSVLMYDNNFPGVTRVMDFDRNANSWRYEASPNPDIDPFTYEGNATTSTQWLTPTRSGLGVQPCPFCTAPAPGKEPAYEQVSIAGDPVNHAHLLLTDDRGRRTGYVGNRLVREIPGVKVIPIFTNQNWRLKTEPTYLVPHGLKYSISIDGSRQKAADTEALSVIGPGYSTVLSDLRVDPGERHAVTIRGSGTKLSYRPPASGAQSPDIAMGFDGRGANPEFTVATHRLRAGATLTASVNPAGDRLLLGGRDGTGGRTVVNFRTTPRSGQPTFRQDSLAGTSGSCDFRSGSCRRR